MRIDLPDPGASAALGARLSDVVRPGDVIELTGELGMGKTTLARSIIAGLGFADEVPSPSFAIVQVYDPPEVRVPVIHADLYRIEDPSEWDELGLDEAMDDAVTLIEWPERIGGIGHENCLAIRLEPAPEGRHALLIPGKGWIDRLP